MSDVKVPVRRSGVPAPGRGVIEVTRENLSTVTRVRHRRVSTDPEALSASIACSDDEQIVFPFDQVDVPLCEQCWGRSR